MLLLSEADPNKALKQFQFPRTADVENGHTLHLVARQPMKFQSSVGSPNVDVAARRQNANAASTHPQVGHVSHNVVLGTIGAGDQDESNNPDIRQLNVYSFKMIGAVLNSFGISGQTPMSGISATQLNMQSLPIPPGAPAPVPRRATPIPDSLYSISEFMDRMELALSHNIFLLSLGVLMLLRAWVKQDTRAEEREYQESEIDHLGKPIAVDAGVNNFYLITTLVLGRTELLYAAVLYRPFPALIKAFLDLGAKAVICPSTQPEHETKLTSFHGSCDFSELENVKFEIRLEDVEEEEDCGTTTTSPNNDSENMTQRGTPGKDQGTLIWDDDDGEGLSKLFCQIYDSIHLKGCRVDVALQQVVASHRAMRYLCHLPCML
ncbi:hypothetical protein Tco_1070093 [Tanacetum coccineum]|uniref:Uncharacterized protein n=1 Tax=Tanacetum coccineum TaxID=301880 RepID=A0ABQ5HLU9_9ASTR